MLQLLPDAALSLFLPQACHLCDREVTSAADGVTCLECWEKTKIFDGTETLCIKCGAFLIGNASTAGESRCDRCQDQYFDHAVSLGLYEHALKAAVLSLKTTPHIHRRLKDLISRLTVRHYSEPRILIPAPLSPRRLHERGFNQAATIARVIARVTKSVIDEHTLVRRSHTQMHRAGMDRKAREKTVAGAFEVVRPNLIRDRSVVIVDDVLTSGATASACSLVLKESGTSEVHVFTLARAA